MHRTDRNNWWAMPTLRYSTLRHRPVALSVRPSHKLIRLLVAQYPLSLGIEAHHPADAGGDVAEVGQAARQVADLDVGGGLGRLAPGADALEEVAVVGDRVELGLARFLRPGRLLIVAGFVELPAGLLRQDDRAFRAVERVAVLGPFLDVRRPDPLFVDELLALRLAAFAVLVLVNDVLRVWELLVVFEEVLS